MKAKRLSLLAAVLAGLGSVQILYYPAAVHAADAAVVQPKEGWYGKLVGFDALRPLVDIPPVKGVMIGIDNVAPQAFDWEFENANWTENHRFYIGDFRLDTLWFKEGGARQPYFYDSMGKIDFTVRYERARQVVTNLGMIGRTFKYEKSYSISAFMKNHIDQPD